jgi:hypothetical protein
MTFQSGVTGSSGATDYTKDQVDALQKQYDDQTTALSALNTQLASTRLSQYAIRKNLLDRIRAAERKIAALLAKLTEEKAVVAGDAYARATQYSRGSVHVMVDISLDGTSYSNPAPTVPSGSIIWVRCTISQAHVGTSGSGVPVTHELAHLTWIPGAGYVAQDSIPASGHDVYFVSQPLIITRKFRAPGGDTAKNFLVNVDLYEQQGPGKAGDLAEVWSR